ncbi:MAG TPA: hypothetical protein VF274_08440 [Alphaproteobacteria bacterium]|jgi:hypothetical protein
MRTQSVFLTVLAVLIGGLLVAGDVQAKGKDEKLTEDYVRQMCGDDLQSAGGAFGCTKCPGGPANCNDYSCNYSGKGRQGCWKIPMSRTMPPGGETGGSGASHPVTGVKPGQMGGMQRR